MDETFFAEQFEDERARLRAMAYRMLGSLGEAEDAVQEAWLRLTRAGGESVGNLAAWLTTVTARICLDMLRTRRARREDPLEVTGSEPAAGSHATDPEEEAMMAEAVGHAVLVVLDRLNPAERVAFVLHDVFDMPFEEIAPIVGRSLDATRQLASRGRRRMRGAPALPSADLRAHRATVDAYLAAARAGDLQGVLAVLDPDVILRVDPALMPTHVAELVQGAAAVARRALGFPARARISELALIDGRYGVVVAPHGHLVGVLLLTIENDRITGIEAIGAPERLARLDIALPED